MQPIELETLFDQQADGYDAQWQRTAPIRDGLLLLVYSVFRDLPDTARILCVGAGTGAEIVELARLHPRWRFTAVDPSRGMIDVCRRNVTTAGVADRCRFHTGYLATLPGPLGFDAATAFLVSQFLLDEPSRIGFFREIAAALLPGGVLASADLAADTGSAHYEALLPAWFHLMSRTGLSEEGLAKMRQAYGRDVAMLEPHRIESLIQAAGFSAPVPFYQAGLIHAWFSRVPATPG